MSLLDFLRPSGALPTRELNVERIEFPPRARTWCNCGAPWFECECIATMPIVDQRLWKGQVPHRLWPTYIARQAQVSLGKDWPTVTA